MILKRNTHFLTENNCNMNQEQWEKLSPEEKRIDLYERQKAVLDQFLKTGAISQAQHDKSLHDLTEKMNIHD